MHSVVYKSTYVQNKKRYIELVTVLKDKNRNMHGGNGDIKCSLRILGTKHIKHCEINTDIYECDTVIKSGDSINDYTYYECLKDPFNRDSLTSCKTITDQSTVSNSNFFCQRYNPLALQPNKGIVITNKPQNINLNVTDAPQNVVIQTVIKDPNDQMSIIQYEAAHQIEGKRFYYQYHMGLHSAITDKIDYNNNGLYISNECQLAPGINNLGNTCFFNAATHLFYRMHLITDFVTHPNIKKQYDKDKPFGKFIEMLKNMKADANDGTGTPYLAEPKIPAKEICTTTVSNYVFGQQASADEFLKQVLACMDINADSAIYSYTIPHSKLYKIVTEPTSGSSYTVLSKQLPLGDPRTYARVFNVEYRCDTGLECTGKEKLDPQDPVKCEADHNNDKPRNRCGSYDKFKMIYPEDPLNYKDISVNGESSLQDIINNIQNKMNPLTFDYRLHYKKDNIIASKYLIITFKLWDEDGAKKELNLNLLNNNGEFTISIRGDDQTYKLTGMVLHGGDTANSGHYIAYINYNDAWYEYDDTNRNQKNIPGNDTQQISMGGYGKPSVFIALYENITSKFSAIDPDKVSTDDDDIMINYFNHLPIVFA